MIELQEMTAADVADIAALERLCVSAPWSENSIAEELETGFSLWLVARLDGAFAGYVGAQLVPPEADMMNLAVVPELRRRGTAQALLQALQERLAARGIGMIHTVSGVGFARDLDVDLERFFARGITNGMQMRVFMQTLDVNKAVKRKLPRIGGCFETALDGCFGSMDAALLSPYENTSDCGVLYYSDEKVTEFCKAANRAGLQIEMHAIGDKAFVQAVRAIKAALDDLPREDHRHTIIHACLPTAEEIAVCERYHINLAVQTAFIDWPQEPDSYLEQILGERAGRLNPIRTFCEHGLILSAGSDGPCTDPDPLLWMYKACNHSNPAESISVQQALRMCTYNGYYTTFDERERGSLEAGKIADMVLLDRNPYDIPKEELASVKVKQLYLRGQEYKKGNGGGAAQILRGMIKRGKC